MADELQDPVTDFTISIEKREGYELSPEVSAAIEALAEAVAAEESEVSGYAFGQEMTFGKPQQLVPGLKLGPIVICGCNGDKNCRCNGGSFSKAFEVQGF